MNNVVEYLIEKQNMGICGNFSYSPHFSDASKCSAYIFVVYWVFEKMWLKTILPGIRQYAEVIILNHEPRPKECASVQFIVVPDRRKE